MSEVRDAVLLDFARTPFGLANRKTPGFFEQMRADDLAAIIVEALLKRTGIEPVMVDEVIMGTVNQVGEQANPGRSVSLITCPFEVAGLSVERACCSSMTAAHIACMTIQLGLADIVVAGGMESHSHFPTPLITEETDISAMVEEYAKSRAMPNAKVFDRVDINLVASMGLIAEKLAGMFKVTREEQDEWAVRSNLRAAAAHSQGRFKHEIIPIQVPRADGSSEIVDRDQGVRADSNIDKVRGLPPLYASDGTVCAASTSGENDGAAAAIFTSKEKARQLGLVPMATLRSMAWVGIDPAIMGYGAIAASKKAFERAGLSPDQMDLVEVNEAFAVLPLMQIKEMDLDPERVNVNGGACCIGHPVGASGIRILGTLAHEMNRRESKHGLAAICGAWGAGAATILERETYWDGRRSFLG
jgi:acetyl-CoA acetyltransferase family protein